MRSAIVIDPTSATAIHVQIYESWRKGILAGRFRRGERMPSTRELSASLGVARGTVAQAYEQLLAEGYLQTQRGAGTFVCGELPDTLGQPLRVSPTISTASMDFRLSKYAERLDEDFRYAPQPAGFILFSRWVPDTDAFPVALWRKSMARALHAPASTLLNYARDPQGYEPLRQEVAAYLSRSRAVQCTAEQVVILNGSQQALDFCARLLAEPGDSVAFENPGYLGTRRIFTACGLQLQPARVDEEGIVIGDLHKQSRLVYVTPSHQYPTGVAMSLQRRLELLAWARKHRAVIIEDDYDSEYRYSGPPLPALQGMANDAPVVYCGSFSKVMFPSLRIGYVVLPPQLVTPFNRAKWIADRHTPIVEQIALTDFLSEGHLERHIRRMRKLYGKRRQVLVDALQKQFDEDVQIYGDAAGMHVMARFDDKAVYARALRNKVQIVNASDLYLGKAPGNEYLFGFSSVSERVIREGIKRLAK
jgi:GntR family transcriptional regulator/MocR family aminotransferase